MSIQVKGISKTFGDGHVLNNVSLEVKSGELIALLGPSGSGKTTLLRIIAGMEEPDAGTVILDGEEALFKKAGERRVGFVFQHYALFKHMTVFENVAFGLRVRPKEHRLDEQAIRKKVMQLLGMVHLDSFYDRVPSQLSGGQRQRVALARALAVEPKLLLLDEPFGALDAKVRKELRRHLRQLHEDMQITSIFVTHDQEEAMEVADRVVVMSNGRIEQVGSPEEVYHHPVSSFVYDFLGNYNVFDGWMDDAGAMHLWQSERPESITDSAISLKPRSWLHRYPEISRILGKILPIFGRVDTTKERISLQSTSSELPERKLIKLFARPHEIFVTKQPDEHDYVRAKVLHINPAGALVKVEMERTDGQLLTVELSKQVLDMLDIQRSDILYVRPRNTRVFDDTTLQE